MNTSNGVLALVVDEALRHDVDRIAAAAGVHVVHASEPSNPKAWTAASAVLLDLDGAERCVDRALPRRGRLFALSRSEPEPTDWPALLTLGAERVLTIPRDEAALVSVLSDAAESIRLPQRRGAVLGIIGARGGAGASVFATALAHEAGNPLLVDVDPWGGGIDLAVGSEHAPGLRWSDLALHGGRIGWGALRAALPVQHDIAVLSAGRDTRHVDAVALATVVDAGSRGGATVICDLARRATPAVEAALGAADLVAVVTPADVRSCAAAGAIAPWLTSSNANVGLVVRGPAPGGLTAAEVARAVGLPLLAAMRPQPGLEGTLERAGLVPGRRSPLARAARRVLGVLRQVPGDLSSGVGGVAA